MSKKIQIVFGPTASGKTEFAVCLAKEIGNCEIVNADSMQIYKDIPIITNQPTEDEKQGIEHHLFGIKNIVEHSDLGKWLDIAVPQIRNINERGLTAIVVGGTGMYLKALVEGVSQIPKIPTEISSKIKQRIDDEGVESLYKELSKKDPLSKSLKPNDQQRITRALEVFDYTKKSIFEWNKIPNKEFFKRDGFDFHFVDGDREDIYTKINKRFDNMIENGVLDEAKKADKIFKNSTLNQVELNALPAYKAHGLREIIAYINGLITKEDAIDRSKQVTRNYAKRQFTWWRSWSKTLKL
jgi:tRNA dimethylallyltransferase